MSSLPQWSRFWSLTRKPTVRRQRQIERRGNGATAYRRRTSALEFLEPRTLLSVAPQTYVVTNTNDSGAGSLRDAITQANADSYSGTAHDTITFAPSLAGQTIDLTTIGDTSNGATALTIAHNVVIDASAAPGLTVARDATASNFRIFTIDSGVNVTLNGLTVSGGIDASTVYSGGGLLNFGTATLTNDTFTGNSGDFGGAVGNLYGTLTLTNDTISGNSAVNNSGGGGLDNTDGTVTLTNDTFTGNSALNGQGGGLRNNSGTVTLTNDTFTGNSAVNGAGGGLFNFGTATLANDTFTNNSATYGGGGVYNDQHPVTLSNTIVAGNFVSGSSYPTDPSEITNSSGTLTGSNNLIGAPNSAGGLSNGSNGNIVGNGSGQAIALSTLFATSGGVPVLADNGGPTQTIALVAGSPAIDAGSAALPGAPTTDQRGALRGSLGLNAGANPDIGAYEASSSFLVTSTADSGGGSLRAAVGWANGNVNVNPANTPAAPNTVAFAPSLAGQTIDLTSIGDTSYGPAALAINGNVNVVIDASAAPGLIITRDATAADFRIFTIGIGANVTLNGVTVSGGVDASTSYGSGGLLNDGTVTLTNDTFADNSTVQGNGGGVANDHTAILTDDTFTGNSANSGGGLYNGYTATLTNDTFTGNSAQNGGGGLYNTGTATLTNDTFSGNSARFGGGLENFHAVTLNNTIIAGNYSAGSSYPTAPSEIYNAGTLTGANNLIGNPNTAGGLANGSSGNIVGTVGGQTIPLSTIFAMTTGANPVPLLADNGGPTQTIALVPGSPAIGAGSISVPGEPTTDQRGFARSNGAVDIGAFEDQVVVNPPSPSSVTVQADSAYSFALGSFTDPVPGNTLFTVTVDWGDGATSTFTQGSTGTINAALHTYPTSGDFTATVLVADPFGDQNEAQFEVNVLPVRESLTPAGSFSATEGVASAVQILAGFTDSRTDPRLFTATIDWGDHTTTTATFLGGGIVNDGPIGQYSVVGSHTYAGDGAYTIAVTVDNGQAVSLPADIPANVAETPNELSVTGGATVTLAPGQAVSSAVLATFTDVNPVTDAGQPDAPSSFVAIINWGDGTTTAGTVVPNGTGGYNVEGSHNYAAYLGTSGTEYTPTISVAEAAELLDTYSAQSTVDVAATTVTLSPINGAAAVEGQNGAPALATITTNNLRLTGFSFAPSIVYGDGLTATGSVTGANGSFTVSGPRTFTREGILPATVAVLTTFPDSSTSQQSANTLIAVSDPAVVPDSVALTPTPQGVPTGSITLATFTDPGGAEVGSYALDEPKLAAHYTATINWGDGTSANPDIAPATITYNGTPGSTTGLFNVSGQSHIYYTPGNYSVTVTINHENSPPLSVHDVITVTARDLIHVNAVSLSGNPGQPLTDVTVGSFTDGYPFTDTGARTTASSYSAAINWGDGGPATPATITPNGLGGYNVTASHTYSTPGHYQTTLVVAKNGEPNDHTQAFGSVDIAPAQISAQGATGTASEGNSYNGPVATITTNNGALQASDFSAMINWGDGTVQRAAIVGTNGQFAVEGAHTFADEGTYPVLVKISEPVYMLPNTIKPATRGIAEVVDVTGSVSVHEADVFTPHGLTIAGTSGTVYSGTVATFSDSNLYSAAGDFRAMISWGDGAVTPGIVSGAGGGLSVSGSHAFATGGAFYARVTLFDDAPGTAATTAFTRFDITGSTYQAVARVNPSPVVVPNNVIDFALAHWRSRRKA